MSERYILKDGEAVPCEDLMEWGRWMQDADRTVAHDTLGESRVSTVFLGLDHAFGGAIPILWETMVFGGPLDQEMDRYSSKAAAAVGHAKMCARVRAAEPQP